LKGWKFCNSLFAEGSVVSLLMIGIEGFLDVLFN